MCGGDPILFQVPAAPACLQDCVGDPAGVVWPPGTCWVSCKAFEPPALLGLVAAALQGLPWPLCLVASLELQVFRAGKSLCLRLQSAGISDRTWLMWCWALNLPSCAVGKH